MPTRLPDLLPDHLPEAHATLNALLARPPRKHRAGQADPPPLPGPEPPLLAARRRFEKRAGLPAKRRAAQRASTLSRVNKSVKPRRRHVAELRALGKTERGIARELGVSTTTVSRDLASADVKEDIRGLREQIRQIILGRTARDAISPMMDLAAKMARDEDPKGLDATWRAIYAAEKATQSASGERAGIGEPLPPPPPTVVDLKLLIGQIIGQPAQ